MIVVADSGPLINLARVSRFGLLHDLYDEVLLPAQVNEEVSVQGHGLPGSAELSTAPWCRLIQPVLDISVMRPTYPQIGAGEVAAIMNALQLQADLLLCDDLAARRVAEALGQRVKGTLGVLVEAK